MERRRPGSDSGGDFGTRRGGRGGGAVEVADGVVGRIRLAKISDFSAKSLHGFVEDNIARGTTIKTDGWSAYPRRRFTDILPDRVRLAE